MEKYELAVFSDKQSNRDGLEAAVNRQGKSKLAAQFSLFAINNENVLEDLRTADLNYITPEDAKLLLQNLKDRIV